MDFVIGWEYSKNDVRYDVRLGKENAQKAREWLASEGLRAGEPLLVNISAGKDFCQWSEERNLRLLELLRARHPEERVALNAAPQDRAQAERLVAAFPGVRLLPVTHDALDLAAFIQTAGAVITPDTSVVHFASAYRVPLVAYYLRLSFGADWLPFGNFPYRVVVTEGEEPAETLKPEQIANAFAEIRNSQARAAELSAL